MSKQASHLALILPLLLLAKPCAAQGQPVFEQLSPRSYVYISPDSSSANGALFVGDSAALVVDPGKNPEVARSFMAAAEELSPVPIRYVLLSHWHPDHGLGLAADLGREFVLISHPQTRRLLAERGTSLLASLDGNEGLAVHRLLADMLITENESIDLGDMQVEIIYPGPAHTQGDLVLWSPSDRVLVTGDLFLRDSCPDIGGGNVENLIAALDRLDALAPAVVIPGHFARSERADMRRFRDYLRSLRSQMRTALDAGLSPSAAAAGYEAGDFADFSQHPQYAATFEQNARAVAAELMERPPERGELNPFNLRRVLEVGRNPHQISFSADGSVAFVAAAGSNQIARVATATLETLAAWPADSSPLGVMEQPPGEQVLVSHFGSDRITKRDLPSGEELAYLSTGAGPSLFSGPYPGSHDPDGRRLLLVAERANRLWVLDAASFEFITQYPTGKRPFPPAATSDGRKAFVPNYDDGTVSIIDLFNQKVLGSTAVGTQPSGGLVLPGDMEYAVAVRGEDHVAFINCASHQVVQRLRAGIGKSPFSIVLSPDGLWAFVNNTASHDVSVIRLADRRVIARIPTGEIPICMAVHPNGRSLWVGCEGSHELQIFDIPGNEPIPSQAEVEPTQVAVLGMIHGRHRDSQRWGLEQLRQAIDAIDPDVVITEIPPDRWQRIWADYAERGVIEDPRIQLFPEYTDVLLPMKLEKGFVIEPCAGWTEEMADLRRERIRQFEEDDRWSAIDAQYQEQLAKVETDEQRRVASSDDPLVLHSPAYTRHSHARLQVYDSYLNDWIGPGGWTNINNAHMALIQAAIERHRGKRLLITFGAGHKYWILDKVGQMPSVELVDVRPFLEILGEASMEELCKKEVLELHQFFEDWFATRLPNNPESFARFDDVIASDFELVSPEGLLSDRAAIVDRLTKAHGSDPQSKIWIKNFSGRPVGDDLMQVTYEEWQGQGGDQRGRLSSALFRRKPGLANQVEWLHVHEVWLPGSKR